MPLRFTEKSLKEDLVERLGNIISHLSNGYKNLPTLRDEIFRKWNFLPNLEYYSVIYWISPLKQIKKMLLLARIRLDTNPSKTFAAHPRMASLFSRSRSRTLTKSTWQITPPTKNSHSPPPIESRKSSQSVNPHYIRIWWVSLCWVKLSRRLHSWWCPSVNSFKFQLCNHTSPGTQTLWFPVEVPKGSSNNTLWS